MPSVIHITAFISKAKPVIGMKLMSGLRDGKHRSNMTTNEAKKDLAKKLSDLHIPFEKLTARTISFQGFGYGNALFVSVHGATWRKDANLGIIKSSLTLKPSEGGYVPEAGKDCKWMIDGVLSPDNFS